MNPLETFVRIVFAPSTVYKEPEPEAVDPMAHLVCGVPDCLDGVIVEPGPPLTVIECETHNARTTRDTLPREQRDQQIIRVQDAWRQHGISKTPR